MAAHVKFTDPARTRCITGAIGEAVPNGQDVIAEDWLEEVGCPNTMLAQGAKSPCACTHTARAARTARRSIPARHGTKNNK